RSRGVGAHHARTWRGAGVSPRRARGGLVSAPSARLVRCRRYLENARRIRASARRRVPSRRSARRRGVRVLGGRSMMTAPWRRRVDLAGVRTTCSFCPKLCRHECPVAIAEKSEVATPTFKQQVAKLAAARTISLDVESARALYKCTGCLASRTP